MSAFSLQNQEAFQAARRALRTLGPAATIDDVFAAVSGRGPFLGGFFEVYREARPWQATHVPVRVPAELTQAIMQRAPHEPQPALEAVSKSRVGALTSDRDAMPEAEWSRVEQYQALKVFGFGQAAALKLSTSRLGGTREHRYMALLLAADAPPLSLADRSIVEALHPYIRNALVRISVPLIAREPLLAQVVHEQRLGMVSLSAGLEIEEANSEAYALAFRYGAVLGVRERRGALRGFVDRLLAAPIDPSAGCRRVGLPGKAQFLEATTHHLDPAVYDLPGARRLMILRESRAPDRDEVAAGELARLSPALRRIAVRLTETAQSYKEIAAALELSEHTVRTQVERIYRVYDVHSRTELALWVRRG